MDQIWDVDFGLNGLDKAGLEHACIVSVLRIQGQGQAVQEVIGNWQRMKGMHRYSCIGFDIDGYGYSDMVL